MAKITLNKTQKILVAVIAVCAALAIALGAYSIVTKQNPVDTVKAVFTDEDEKIVGKWQSIEKPGLSAFVFYDDGTYDSYISTVNFTGEYTISGNKLTLVNPTTAKTIVYRFTVDDTKLTLQVVEDENVENPDNTKSNYERVDELNQKTLSDMIGELGGNKENTSEKK